MYGEIDWCYKDASALTDEQVTSMLSVDMISAHSTEYT